MSLIDKLIKIKEYDKRQKLINEFIKPKITSDFSIKKRNFFFQNRKQIIPYYYKLITKLNELEKDGELVYLIRGSSAWFNNIMNNIAKGKTYNIDSFDDMYHDFKTSIGNVNMVASLLAQNWDFSIFINKQKLKDVFKIINEYVGDIKKQMNKDNINAQKISYNKDLDHLENFKGYYIALCLDNREYSKYQHFSDYVCNDISPYSFFAFWITLHPVENLNHIYDNFVKPITVKLPASIINCYEPNITIQTEKFPNPKLQKETIKKRANRTEEVSKYKKPRFNYCEMLDSTANFLNFKGLLMFTIFMDSKYLDRTSEKGINIDKYRIKWLENDNIKRGIIYKELFEIWSNTFKDPLDCIFEDKWQLFNINDTFRNSILKNIMNIDNSSSFDLIDTRLIEFYRGVINTIVIDLHRNITTYKDEYIERIDVMIVGGDAFTRYIDKSKTSDIDVKVTVIPKKATEKTWMPDNIYEEIQQLVISILSKYIVYLNYTIKFSDIYTQFRLREWSDSKGGNFHLFSIDCRTIHNVKQLGNKTFNLENYNHDLALLDVSIDFDNKRYYANDKTIEFMDVIPIKRFQCNYIDYNVEIMNLKLPVASPEFLIKEMNKRYKDPYLLEKRFYVGKIDKDIERYKTLKTNPRNFKENNVFDLFMASTLIREDKNLDSPKSNFSIYYYGYLYSGLYNYRRNQKKTKLFKKKFKFPFSLSHSENCKYMYSIRPELCDFLDRKIKKEDPRLPLIYCKSTEFKNIINNIIPNFKFRCLNITPELFNTSPDWGKDCD